MDTLFLHPETWDLVADAEQNIALAKAPYATAQDVATICRLWKGEARYNTTRGIPYEKSILGKKPSLSILANWYETEAEMIVDVKSARFDALFDEKNRKLTGTLEITRTNGEKNVLSL